MFTGLSGVTGARQCRTDKRCWFCRRGAVATGARCVCVRARKQDADEWLTCAARGCRSWLRIASKLLAARTANGEAEWNQSWWFACEPGTLRTPLPHWTARMAAAVLRPSYLLAGEWHWTAAFIISTTSGWIRRRTRPSAVPSCQMAPLTATWQPKPGCSFDAYR